MVASRRAAVISAAAAVITAVSAKAPKGKTPGLSRAMTRGVPPLRLRSTCGLARRWCLPFLLANQTALTPSAKPPGKPGLHHSHPPLLSWKGHGDPGWATPLHRLLVPGLYGRRRQRTGTVEVLCVRPQNDADSIADVAKHIPCAAYRGESGGEAGSPAGPGIWPGGVHRAPTTSAGGAALRAPGPAAMMGDQADGHALLR